MQPQDPLQPPTPSQTPEYPNNGDSSQAPVSPNPVQPQTPSPQPPISPQSPMPAAQSPNPAPSSLPPAPQPSVDTSTLFAPDGMSPPLPPAKSPRKRLLVALVACVVLALIGASTFLLVRSRSDRSTPQPDIPEASLNEATEALGAELPADIVPDEPEATDAEKTTDASEPTPSQTTQSSSSNTKTPKNSGPLTVTCKKDSRYSGDLPASAIKQVQVSINAALAGKTSGLIKWLPAKYKIPDKEADPAKVNASFAKLKPKSCKVLPVIVREKNDYSTGGMSLYVTFDKNAYGKPYSNRINLAIVKKTWKTEHITTAGKSAF